VRFTTRVVCDLLRYDYTVVCDLLREQRAIYYATTTVSKLRLNVLVSCKGGWVKRKLQRELFRKWDHLQPQVRRVKVMTTAESESVRKNSSERVIPSRGGTHCRE